MEEIIVIKKEYQTLPRQKKKDLLKTILEWATQELYRLD